MGSVEGQRRSARPSDNQYKELEVKTLLLEEMTSAQIRKAIDEGYKTVIVAAGSIEQHGKHLPVGTDTMGGYDMAVSIANGLGHTLVAPVIRPGCSDHHMAFSGTISISAELLKELCRAYCRCLCQHGFETIVLIAAHGGNIEPMQEVAPELDEELPCTVVAPVLLGDRLLEATDPILPGYGVTPEEGGLHAGFAETSMVLATPYAHLVDMPAAERGFVGDIWARLAEVTRDGHYDLAEISPVGVLGDATKASAEAGHALNAASDAVYLEIVREALRNAKDRT
jgi:creatinine amidohydrolase